MREELKNCFDAALEHMPERLAPDEVASCMVAFAYAYAREDNEVPAFVALAMTLALRFQRDMQDMENSVKH